MKKLKLSVETGQVHSADATRPVTLCQVFMEINLTRPLKLYRYSTRKWLERSLKLGEFRLRPASDYKQHELDLARHDDEIVRINKSPVSAVTILSEGTEQNIKPISEVTYRSEAGTNYLTICFSDRWGEHFFDVFPGTDSCLIINDVKNFCERFHEAAELALPQWVGMDAAVIYGNKSELGTVFSKPRQFIVQHEWRFAWRPLTPLDHLDPLTIKIGSIASIAEIIDKP